VRLNVDDKNERCLVGQRVFFYVLFALRHNSHLATAKSKNNRELGVASVRVQAALKRGNLLRAIEQAEIPFAWHHRFRAEREKLDEAMLERTIFEQN